MRLVTLLSITFILIVTMVTENNAMQPLFEKIIPMLEHMQATSPSVIARLYYLALDPRKSINIRDSDGFTALHRAVGTRNHYMVYRLLITGMGKIDVNPHAHGEFNLSITPLHFAVLNDDSEMLAMLQLAGARTTEQDSDGLTPLDWAKQLHVHGIRLETRLLPMRKIYLVILYDQSRIY